ncbi:MAG: alpha/beta hydrolase [Anaerovoracaceae bacterium]
MKFKIKKAAKLEKKDYLKFFGVVGIIVVVFVVIGLVGNHFNIDEKEVEIQTSKGTLKGTLVLPKDKKEDLGLVVFVHGDGPLNADSNGTYKPLWERLAQKGYASLSWNKPGVKKAEGNWQEQSMEDRAKEAVEAINWARELPEIDKDRIGIIGTSQAGWVLPKISKMDKDIAFNILAAPSVNWLEDGKYSTAQKLKKKKASKSEIEKGVKEYEDAAALFGENSTYKEYKKAVGKERALPEKRWTFIMTNYKEDVKDELKYYYSPVKLIVGDLDTSVDSKNTIKVYKEGVDSKLLDSTLLKGTDHYMINPGLVKSEIKTSFVATLLPKNLLDKNYYEAIEKFLDSIK